MKSIPSIGDPDVFADIARTRDGRVCIRIRHHFVGVPAIMVHPEPFFEAMDGNRRCIEDESVAPAHSLWVDSRRDGRVGLEVRWYQGDDVYGLDNAFFDRADILDAAGPRPDES